uniref:Probetacellulin n=1 Tax=Lepisosteus oculatus TaxID=7918 RepID=W5N2J0_LEPOC
NDLIKKMIFVIISCLALCKYAHADSNVTKEPESEVVSCGHHGNKTCTAVTKVEKWSGHFSNCPEEYIDYCIKGKCRFVVDVQQPACICERGYIGHRCELLDFFYQKTEQKQIIIASVIAALVFLILLIIFICCCAHRRKLCFKRRKRKEEKTEEIEKLNTILSEKPESHSVSVNVDASETNTV